MTGNTTLMQRLESVLNDFPKRASVDGFSFKSGQGALDLQPRE